MRVIALDPKGKFAERIDVTSVPSLGAAQTLLQQDHDEPWYSVRCHFLHRAGEWSEQQMYEERITLWKADSFEHAIQRAEVEALEYIESINAVYLNAATSYHLFEVGFAIDGAEVFSEMRRSDLEASAYLDRFFFTRGENGNHVSHG